MRKADDIEIHHLGDFAALEKSLVEQDRWLLEDRDAINAKIKNGIRQLDRGEGIPEDQLDAYLATRKAKHE